jgi:hypothetical protein
MDTRCLGECQFVPITVTSQYPIFLQKMTVEHSSFTWQTVVRWSNIGKRFLIIINIYLNLVIIFSLKLVNCLTVKFKESKFCSNQKTLAYLLKVFTLRIKLCISSHAQSRKREITVRFRGYCIILGQQCATWSSTFRRLEFGSDFLFFRRMLNLCYKVHPCTGIEVLYRSYGP